MLSSEDSIECNCFECNVIVFSSEDKILFKGSTQSSEDRGYETSINGNAISSTVWNVQGGSK